MVLVKISFSGVFQSKVPDTTTQLFCHTKGKQILRMTRKQLFQFQHRHTHLPLAFAHAYNNS